MKDLEKILREGKLETDKLEIPIELEARLRGALEAPRRHRRGSGAGSTKRLRAAAAVLLIAVVLLGYNFDTLAFYGKRLIGYDRVMNTTLKQLNDAGKGQLIGKSHTFSNGVTFTLEGIMLDANQLLVFYTEKDPRGNIDSSGIAEALMLRGSMGRYFMNSSQGEMNTDKTEIKYIASFDAPFFLERRLSIDISMTEGQKHETAAIGFTLDRDKAMGHILKKSINKSINAGGTNIHFASILASPTETVIKGSLEGIIGLALDTMREDRFRPRELGIQLLANGKELPQQGSEMSTDMRGITFQYRYDALPPGVKQLQLRLKSFGADHDVKQTVILNRALEEQTVEIMGQRIDISEIMEVNGETYMTISTEDSVFLTSVKLLIDGKSAELDETFGDQYIKKPDGTVIHTRTLHFPGTGKELRLDIQKMAYTENYDAAIDIPLD